MTDKEKRLKNIQDKYPKVAKYLEDTNTADKVDRVMWVNSLDKNDFAVLLNEMLFKIGSACSDSIELRNNAKKNKTFYYNIASKSTHLFARHEALGRLGLTTEDLKKLFPHAFPDEQNQTKIKL